MPITVKHSKVSTIPDAGDSDLVRPSDWNADHTLTGTIDIANGGTGQTTANAAFNALAPSQTGNTGKVLTTDGTNTTWSTNGSGTVTSVAATAGTGISVSGSPITTSGTLTITNTAPDQTVVLTAGTGISTSGTYPNFTITNTSPSLGGDVVGPASSTDNAIARYDTTTGKLIQNSLVIIDDTGSVTGVNALTAQSLTVNNNATLGSSNTDSLDVRARISSDLDPETNNAKDIGTNGRNWRDGFFGRTVHTVNLELTGTTSFDGSQGTAGQVLTSAGTGATPTWTTPTTGTVTSVTGTAPVVSSGGNTPAISMAAATGSVDGYLTSTDWTTFNGKANAFTYTSNYIPYGQGTTTPTQSVGLQYNGTTFTTTGISTSNNLAFTGTGNRITGDFSNGTIASRVIFQSSTTNGNTFLSSIPNGSGTLSGYFAYNSSDTANAAQFGLFVNGTTDAQIRAALTGTGTYLPITMYTGGSERLRIDTSGNVGIGTSSPTAPLTIVSNATADGLFLLGRASDNIAVMRFKNNANNTEYARFDARFDQFIINTVANAPMVFNTNNTERMRIASNGYVSIGTTTTAGDGKLSVEANGGGSSEINISLVSGTGNKECILNFGDNLTTAGRYKGRIFYQLDNNVMGFWTNTTERMRIDSSGNLLLGTTSGSNKLEVSNGAADVAVLVKATGANYVTYRMQNTSRDYSMQIRTDQSNSWTLRDETAGANRLLVDTSGIVTMPAYGAGAATFSASGVISSVSDETWKIKDGVPINPDAMLQKLEAGYWFYNEEKAPIFGSDRQLGFYAQNVHEAIGEEAAPTPEEGKPWGYYDRSVLAVTVMSLKNALSTIEELKQRIATLENK